VVDRRVERDHGVLRSLSEVEESVVSAVDQAADERHRVAGVAVAEEMRDVPAADLAERHRVDGLAVELEQVAGEDAVPDAAVRALRGHGR
jgi:hypothetical protein